VGGWHEPFTISDQLRANAQRVLGKTTTKVRGGEKRNRAASNGVIVTAHEGHPLGTPKV
jgi:hypothetical protein